MHSMHVYDLINVMIANDSMLICLGALFLLAVNLCRYKFDNPEYFYESVGHWLKFLAARVPKARVVIVPTHIDCCKPEEVDLKCRNILQFIIEEQEEMCQKIDEKMKNIVQTQGFRIPEEDKNDLFAEQMEKKNNLPVVSLNYKDVSVTGITCFFHVRHTKLNGGYEIRSCQYKWLQII